ncbi:MAG: hypothetical protein HQM16_18505 [Deltaproteobacteria bacterium]|nr:hypothetical protein [Deltaproteobacteria bacterium]
MKTSNTVIMLIMLLMSSWSVSADYVRVSVGQAGGIVTQRVVLVPGYAVLIEVPQDIVSYTLADQNIIQCAKIPPHQNKMTCKALSGQKYSTNLIISTDKHEINLIMEIDPATTDRIFKYVFYDSQQTQATRAVAVSDYPGDGPPLSLEGILGDLEVTGCHLGGINKYMDMECDDTVRVGTDKYIRLGLTNRGREKLSLVGVRVTRQVLGGFTGLAVKNETSMDAPFYFATKTLSPRETTRAIIKLPKAAVNDTERLILVIATDRGSDADLVINMEP